MGMTECAECKEREAACDAIQEKLEAAVSNKHAVMVERDALALERDRLKEQSRIDRSEIVVLKDKLREAEARTEEAKDIVAVLLRDGAVMGSCSFIDGDPDLWQCLYCSQKGKKKEDFHADWCAVGHAVALFDLEQPNPDKGPMFGHQERADHLLKQLEALEEFNDVYELSDALAYAQSRVERVEHVLLMIGGIARTTRNWTTVREMVDLALTPQDEDGATKTKTKTKKK